MSALQALKRERTDWRTPVPALSTDHYETTGWEPAQLSLDNLWVPVSRSVHYSAYQFGLLEKAWLDAFTSRVTTVPYAFILAAAQRSETPAQKMVDELRRLSGLTNEEIAPLVGVSRRSLQSWIAGEPISARRENRLRAVLDAIRRLAAPTAMATRERMLTRAPHSVSAYDLLTEERYDAAIDLATGRRRLDLTEQTSTSEPLAAQLDRIEDSFAPAPQLNRKLSGPLRARFKRS